MIRNIASKPRGSLIIDCQGTVVWPKYEVGGVGSELVARPAQAVRQLGRLAENDIALAFATRYSEEDGVLQQMAEMVKVHLGFANSEFYGGKCLELGGVCESDFIHNRSNVVSFFKDFTSIVNATGLSAFDDCQKVVHVEDYSPDLSFVARFKDGDSDRLIVDEQGYPEGALKGFPYPMEGGALPVTIFVPLMSYDFNCDNEPIYPMDEEMAIFRAVVRLTEAIIDGSFPFPDTQMADFLFQGDRWIFCRTDVLLREGNSLLCQEIGSVKRLMEYQRRGSPKYKFLFYVPEYVDLG